MWNTAKNAGNPTRKVFINVNYIGSIEEGFVSIDKKTFKKVWFVNMTGMTGAYDLVTFYTVSEKDFKKIMAVINE